jgi:hypothetical protein
MAGSRQSVRVLGNAQRFELSQTDIALGGGRTIKLADIARVEPTLWRGDVEGQDQRPRGGDLLDLALARGIRRRGL